MGRLKIRSRSALLSLSIAAYMARAGTAHIPGHLLATAAPIVNPSGIHAHFEWG